VAGRVWEAGVGAHLVAARLDKPLDEANLVLARAFRSIRLHSRTTVELERPLAHHGVPRADGGYDGWHDQHGFGDHRRREACERRCCHSPIPGIDFNVIQDVATWCRLHGLIPSPLILLDD
jgi:hypothetical protein